MDIKQMMNLKTLNLMNSFRNLYSLLSIVLYYFVYLNKLYLLKYLKSPLTAQRKTSMKRIDKEIGIFDGLQEKVSLIQILNFYLVSKS